MAEFDITSADPEFVTISETLENGDILHRRAVRIPLREVYSIEKVESSDV